MVDRKSFRESADRNVQHNTRIDYADCWLIAIVDLVYVVYIRPRVGLINTPWDANFRPGSPSVFFEEDVVLMWELIGKNQTTARMSLSGTHSSKPPVQAVVQVIIHQMPRSSHCSTSSDCSREGATLPSLSSVTQGDKWRSLPDLLRFSSRPSFPSVPWSPWGLGLNVSFQAPSMIRVQNGSRNDSVN